MADNVGYTPGSGASIAADDVGGDLYQRIKVAHGADGFATDTSAANPLPTADATAQATLDAINGMSDSMLYMLAAILDKMPRLTAQDRMPIDIADMGNQSMGITMSSGPSTYITNATSNLSSIYFRAFEPWNFSDAGSARLYSNIQVS